MSALTQGARGRAALAIGIVGAVMLLLAFVLVSTASAVDPDEVRVRSGEACQEYGYGTDGESFVIPRSGLSSYEESIDLGNGVIVDLASPPNRSYVDFSVTGALVEGGFIFNRVNSNQANFYDYRPDGVDEGTLEPPPRDNGNDKLIVLCFGVRTEVAIDKVTAFGDGQEADSTSDYIDEGAPIVWEYRVSIPGDEPAEPLSITSVSDDQGETPEFVGGDTDGNGLLDLGETWLYQASGTAGDGAYTNEARVDAVGAGSGRSASDTDTSGYFGVILGLDVDATTLGFATGETEPYVSGDDVYIRTGDAVEWRYVITNESNLPLTNVGVTDSNSAITGITCESTSLAVDASTTCSATGTAGYNDVGVFFENTGTATATAPTGAGTVPSATDDSSYFGYIASFDVDVELVVDGTSYDPTAGVEGDFPVILAGDPITWRFTVENTGNVPVTATVVSELGGDAPVQVCTLPDIDPGTTETCDYDTTAGDGETETAFQVVGSDPNGEDVTETIEDIGYYGGLDCGANVRSDNPDPTGDGPDVGFWVGPVSDPELECGTAVEVNAYLSDSDETQVAEIVAPAGYPFIGTGVVTINWDAIPRDSDPLVRTVQELTGGTDVIEQCAVIVPIELGSGTDYQLVDPAGLYPGATDFDGSGTYTEDESICLIQQFNYQVDVAGEVYMQLQEVYYIWNDPILIRPR